MYYGLQNFYQNHRRYVKSRDDSQLLGRDVSTLNTECAPYDKDQNGNKYAPCGAIANSLFNGTFIFQFTFESILIILITYRLCFKIRFRSLLITFTT